MGGIGFTTITPCFIVGKIFLTRHGLYLMLCVKLFPTSNKTGNVKGLWESFASETGGLEFPVWLNIL
jgi:hypothetical protein